MKIGMVYIIKSVFITILELNIYYCIGQGIDSIKWIPSKNNSGGKLLYGFLTYHFLFFCAAFPSTIISFSLNGVTVLWTGILCMLLFLIIISRRKELLKSYQNVMKIFRRYKLFMLPVLLLSVVLIYYVCINGSVDIDARTYIGEVSSMLATNRVSGIEVTTGMRLDKIRLRRSCAMLGVNSAVLCNIFKIHPYVFCRFVRASINIIMLLVVTFEIFRWIYRKSETAVEDAVMSVMLSVGSLFLFHNTMYTNATFILFRTYEGKAYCSGVLVLVAIYLAILFCETMDMRYFALIFISTVASMSISASAVFVFPAVTGSIISAHIIVEKQWKYFVALIVSFLPNIMYILATLTGFSGFSLEG